MLRMLFMAVLVLFAVPVVSDNFDDGIIDASLWTSGTGFYADPINYTRVVTVDESSGQLVFTHPGNSNYWTANAYESSAAYDVSGRRVSVKLQHQHAEAWLAVGRSDLHKADVTILNAGLDNNDTALRFEVVDADTYDQIHYFWIQAADYDALADAYVALRFTRRGVYCETSSDGINWLTRGLIKSKTDFASNAHIELGGGGFFPNEQNPVTATIDDFKLE